uniref:Ubiquitin fusion degradation protein UFD1 N-terminal subdomain 1 domain-containing protein n=1 Tax=Gouania willdenowi TaxID=441366 RepID=A0A8C5EJH5_GOUWI
MFCFSSQFSFQVFDHPMPRGFQNRFSTQYRCYSVSMLAGPNDRSDVEKGGKIIMPPSALDQLRIPNYDFKIGRITFIRNSRPQPRRTLEDVTLNRFIAFSGEGQSLRKKGRKP